MSMTNKQLAEKYQVTSRQISKHRTKGKRILNPTTNKMDKIPDAITSRTRVVILGKRI